MEASSPPPCDLKIGCSGYDYPEWKGVFYPEKLSRKEYLGFYSEAFETVELNFTYYSQPRAEKLEAMLGRTRRPIDFSVKANRALTHDRRIAELGSAARAFRDGIEPLGKAGRLAAVLLEFPFSFHYLPEERRYLDRLLGELEGLPLVVEFRNAEWFGARVIESLRERRVGLSALDLPRLEGFPPLSDLVTSELGYLRFHGRNEAAWWSGDSGSRYEYRYSLEELRGWLPRIEAMSAQARRLRIYFNNHWHGDAIAGARNLTRLLAEARIT